MPKIEPYTPEWDKKLKKIADRQERSWRSMPESDWSKIAWAAQSYAWMQCDRDFWKEMYMELNKEKNK